MAPKEKNTIKVSRSYQRFIKTMSIFPSCPTWHSNPCKNGLLHYHSRMIVTIANIILYSDILWHLQSTKECYDYHGNVKMLKYMVPPWQFYHSTFYGNIMLLFLPTKEVRYTELKNMQRTLLFLKYSWCIVVENVCNHTKNKVLQDSFNNASSKRNFISCDQWASQNLCTCCIVFLR